MLRFFEGYRTPAVCTPMMLIAMTRTALTHTAKAQRCAAGGHSFFPFLSSSPSVLPVLFSLALGFMVGLSGWPGGAQAALSPTEEVVVSRYVQSFNSVSPSNTDRAGVFADYLSSSPDPYATIQYLLSIGVTFDEHMQILIGSAIAQYVDAIGINNPALSLEISQLVEEQPEQAIISGYTDEIEIITREAKKTPNAPPSEKPTPDQGSPN